MTEDEFSANLTREVLEANQIRFKKTIKTETIETVPYAIRKTGGIHLTGESVRKQSSKDLVYLPITDRKAKTTIYFARLKNNSEPSVEAFFREAACFFDWRCKK